MSNIRKHMYFLKMLISYVIISLLPILIILLYYYPTAMRSNLETYRTSNYYQLKQIQMNIDSQMSNIIKIPLEFVQNPVLKEYYINKNNYNNIRMIEEIGKYVKTNSFIYDTFIYLYNKELLFGKKSAYSSDNFGEINYIYYNWPHDEMIDFLKNLRINVVLPARPVNINYSNVNVQFITYLTPLPPNNDSPYGIAMIMIDDYEVKKFMNVSSETAAGNIIIIDDHGTIITSLNDKYLSDRDNFLNYTENNNHDLKMPVKIDGKKFLTNSIPSSVMNWYYLHLVPSEIALKDTILLRNNAIILLFSLFVIETILAFYFIKSNYNPIQLFLRHINENVNNHKEIKPVTLENEMGEWETIQTIFDRLSVESMSLSLELSNNTKSIRESLLMRLISGQYDNEKEIMEKCRRLGLNFIFPVYLITLMKFNQNSELDMNRLYDVLQSFELANNAENRDTRVYFTPDVRLNCVICVINSKDRDMNEVLQFVDNISLIVRKALKTDIWAAVGSFCDNIEKIHLSYYHASYTSEYLVIKGKKTLEYYDHIVDNQYGLAIYPFELIYNLRFSLLKKDKEAALKAITQINEYLESNQLPMYIIKPLFLDAIGIILDTLTKYEPDTVSHYKASFNMYIYESDMSVSKMSGFINECFQKTCIYFDDKNTTENAKLLENILLHINDNLVLPQLSLISIADTFDMSPSNLSHFFKRKTGQNLYNYITNLKMQKALDLLVKTDLKVKEIAVQLGYSGSSNFGRIFIKIFGMSPGQYRNLSR